jgi:hypothetical protein
MGIRKVKSRRKVKVLVQVGQKFGYLTFLGFPVDDPKGSKNRGIFKCDCGRTKELWFSNVIHGYQETCCGFQAKKWGFAPGETELNTRYRGVVATAEGKGLEIDLTRDDYAKIVAQPCHYCGIPAPFRKHWSYRGGIYAHGIDRVDNSKGYTKENSVSCCKACNYAKHTMSVDEFLVWVKRVYEHSVQKI